MMVLFPHGRKMLLAAAILVVVDPVLPLYSGAETLKSHECFQEFSVALARVKENIPKRFGPEWKRGSRPPEIAAELEWITRAAGELKDKSEKLDSRAWSVHLDESELGSTAKWFKTRSDT